MRLAQGRFRRTDRLETATVILLGLATVVAAWSAYQAIRWNGVEANAITAADSKRAAAAQATVQNTAGAQVDVHTWIAWLQRWALGDVEGATFLQERFRDELTPAFAAWLASAPEGEIPQGTPFDLEEYPPPGDPAVQELTVAANALDEQAVVANRTTDDFILTAVIMAMVVFLASVGTTVRNVWIRWPLFIAAAVLLFGGFGFMLSLPQNVGV